MREVKQSQIPADREVSSEKPPLLVFQMEGLKRSFEVELVKLVFLDCLLTFFKALKYI